MQERNPPHSAVRCALLKKALLTQCFFCGERGIPFLRKSHGGCGVPPAPRQEPPFESHSTNIHAEKENAPTRVHFFLAERVGFEPTDTRISPVFKTGAFNHSTISPCFGGVYCNTNPAGGQSVFNREFCRKVRSRRCAIRSPEDTGRCRRRHRCFRGHISCRWPADPAPFPPVG